MHYVIGGVVNKSGHDQNVWCARQPPPPKPFIDETLAI